MSKRNREVINSGFPLMMREKAGVGDGRHILERKRGYKRGG
jgi:hypothetical protein